MLDFFKKINSFSKIFSFFCLFEQINTNFLNFITPNIMKENDENSSQIKKLLLELRHKYSLTGQNLSDNLEGLLHSKYLKYWDYIHLDTLLSLQTPSTNFPDELIFIVYHQITELYFKLVLHEIEQLTSTENNMSADTFLEKIERMNRYFEHLAYTYEMMVEGMDVEQFRKFRMALLPASGFQSAQIRFIEICATDFINLVHQNHRVEKQNTDIAEMYQYIYWRWGATDGKTGKMTITAQHFQEKYQKEFISLGEDVKTTNLWQMYLQIPNNELKEKIKEALRKFDQLINIDWRLAHYKSAVRYLKMKSGGTIEATGGTNWEKYLPPRFQRIIFYPELWSEEEKENWGKKWVEIHA